MAVPQEVYREFARPGHRLLAAYLAIHAWTNDRDCVVIDREDLLAFWGLQKRVGHKRLNWFKRDIQPFFLHTKALNFSGGGAFASIFLSRRLLPDDAFRSSMSSAKRVALLQLKKVKAAVVQLPPESQMLAILTSVIHGLSDFPTDESES